MSTTQAQPTKTMTLAELQTLVTALQAKVEALETAAKPKDVVEMTKDHAKRILNGDLKDLKHKEAAEKLGLTYGQVYSCRLEFTFKDVHKELKAAGWKNTWVKA